MKKLKVWLPVLIAVVLTIGMVLGFKLREKIPASQTFFSTSNKSALQEVLDLLRMKYVDPIDTDTLTDEAVEAMLSQLDPHSIFIPARNLAAVNEDLKGNFQGIGVEFQIIKDTVHVLNVIAGGPSDVAGLLTGDKFIKVGDSLVAGVNITSDGIKQFLRGPNGSNVDVTILRNDQQIKASIKRGVIPLISVDAAYLIDSTTGFIHLSKFSETTYREFMQALEKLQAKGMKQLILDLRGNGGGILNEAVQIADEFLSGEKIIVYTEGSKQKRYNYLSRRPGLFEEGNLVLLVDEGAASASEVLAGAVQDWDRGFILGRRTFGKGLVQEQYELSNGAALRLTVARYYTPSGRSIQKSYTEGRMAYNEELMGRYNNGEMVNADSLQQQNGKVYTTKMGRKVYGGGGITPDIFVPIDTAVFSQQAAQLFYNNTFGQFIYAYYLENKPEIERLKSPQELANRFNPGENAWIALRNFLKNEKIAIDLDAFSPREKEAIQKRIKTWLARQIWRMEGYYIVNNQDDRMVKEGLKALGKEIK